MADRYFTKPRQLGEWDDDLPLLPSISVTDHVSLRTGLVDRHGDPLFRAPSRIGFHAPRPKK